MKDTIIMYLPIILTVLAIIILLVCIFKKPSSSTTKSTKEGLSLFYKAQPVLPAGSTFGLNYDQPLTAPTLYPPHISTQPGIVLSQYDQNYFVAQPKVDIQL
jgi:hypothetical protein